MSVLDDAVDDNAAKLIKFKYMREHTHEPIKLKYMHTRQKMPRNIHTYIHSTHEALQNSEFNNISIAQ